MSGWMEVRCPECSAKFLGVVERPLAYGWMMILLHKTDGTHEAVIVPPHPEPERPGED